MQFIKILGIILLVIYSVLFLYFSFKSGKFLRTIFVSFLTGLLTMAVVNICSNFTGVNLPVNLYTVVSSACLGAPGVLGLLTIRLFF